MKILKIQLQEQLQIKPYMIKHSIFLTISNTMDGYQSGLVSMIYKFIYNIKGAYFANMQLISKLIKDFDFYYYVTHIYSKNERFVPLKYKTVVAITNAFQINFRSVLSETKAKYG